MREDTNHGRDFFYSSLGLPVSLQKFSVMEAIQNKVENRNNNGVKKNSSIKNKKPMIVPGTLEAVIRSEKLAKKNNYKYD